MSKDSYLLANFSKIKHKSWELYCITRILHKLDDDDLEYICQQLVKKTSGDQFFLTDLCFPILGLYIEINEGQHFTKEAVSNDKNREKEIFDATNWIQLDIDVYDSDSKQYHSLDHVKRRIDEVIEIINNRKIELEDSGRVIKWDYKAKFDPQTYIQKGIIHVNDNISLLYTRDVLELFGYKKGNYQGSNWRIRGTNESVWFPKLYNNISKDGIEWINNLENNSQTIKMNKRANNVFVECPEIIERAIVFAHYKNPLGFVVYRFMGVFEPCNEYHQNLLFNNGKATVNSKTNIYKLVDSTIDLSKYYQEN